MNELKNLPPLPRGQGNGSFVFGGARVSTNCCRKFVARNRRLDVWADRMAGFTQQLPTMAHARCTPPSATCPSPLRPRLRSGGPRRPPRPPSGTRPGRPPACRRRASAERPRASTPASAPAAARARHRRRPSPCRACIPRGRPPPPPRARAPRTGARRTKSRTPASRTHTRPPWRCSWSYSAKVRATSTAMCRCDKSACCWMYNSRLQSTPN
mmetsp:Transcript_15120/g.40143  ORF Transcript_15120/g.40143 Transcript_15120/m.40143 type:complete len:212 (-) Transcript_15120:99-734(-)